MAQDEHGHCPGCNADLNGGSIWQTGYAFAWAGRDGGGDPAMTTEEAETRADAYAEAYGATRTTGRWGREIGISENDRVAWWKCPDCHHEWPR